MKRLNKKGEEDTFFSDLTFLLLTLIVFISLIFWIQKASTKTLGYEEALAKQIALMIDSSEPGEEIAIDVTKFFEVAKKNKMTEQNFKNNFIYINPQSQTVLIKLADKGGYEYPYFKQYHLLMEVKISEKEATLSIKVDN